MVNNQKGFVLIVSMMMLLVLMVIGIAATNTTNIELQISGNDKASKMAFYAAESGLDFAYIDEDDDGNDMYHDTNITPDEGRYFPSGEFTLAVTESTTQEAIGANALQSFQGVVIFKRFGSAPRDAGLKFSTTDMSEKAAGSTAYYYEFESIGSGPGNSQKTVRSGGYRF